MIEYLLHLAILINIYIVLSLFTNMIVGSVKLLSICQAAYFGIGAYISVIVFRAFPFLTFLPVLIITIFLTAFSSILVGYPSLRLKGDYFILCTIAFQLIVYTTMSNWISVTNGSFGIIRIETPALLGIIHIDNRFSFFILSCIFLVISLLIYKRLIESQFGKILKAIGEDEQSVAVLGRDVASFKIIAFLISSGFIGGAGMFYACYFKYIEPNSFSLETSILIISSVLIGGTGNIIGPIIGAIFIGIVPVTLSFSDNTMLPYNVGANLGQVLYGILLIVLMRFRRQGIAGRKSFHN